MNINENIAIMARACLNQRPRPIDAVDLAVLADALEEAGNAKEAKICRLSHGDHDYSLINVLVEIHNQAMFTEERRRYENEIGGCSCGARFETHEEMEEHEDVCPLNGAGWIWE